MDRTLMAIGISEGLAVDHPVFVTPPAIIIHRTSSLEIIISLDNQCISTTLIQGCVNE